MFVNIVGSQDALSKAFDMLIDEGDAVLIENRNENE